MSKYILDWDNRYRKGVIKTDNLEAVRYGFSVEDPGARMRQRYRGSAIPSRKYAITATGRFQIGIGIDIVKFIRGNDDSAKIILTEAFKTELICSYPFSDKGLVCPELDLRDYQEETVKQCLKVGRGVCLVATAGGKTLISSTVINTVLTNIPATRVLFVTIPPLVKQTHDEFIKHGVGANKVSMWDGKHELKNTSVIVASTVMLTRSPPSKDWLKNIDLLIVDECHRIRKNNKITKVINHISTPHRFGFTGTLPDSEIDLWSVIGTFGPVIYEKKSHELISEGYISNMTIKIILISYSDAPDIKPNHAKPTEAFDKEREFLFESDKRNRTISTICSKVQKNMLILVDRLAHGSIIEDMLRENLNSKEVYFIQGSVESEVREHIKQLMEKQDNIICVAMSKIFSTGVDIKNLHYIMFASGGKAKTNIIQSIGRGLRLHDNKEILTVFDITDNLHYGLKHHSERLRLYDIEKMKYNVYKIP